MTEFQMKWDWVAVERYVKDPQKTEAGIYVADGMSEDVFRGRVMGVGIGVLLEDGSCIPPQVKPGDMVMFQPDVGHTFMHKGKQFIAIKERDIILSMTETG